MFDSHLISYPVFIKSHVYASVLPSSDEPVEHSLEWAFQRYGPWANSNSSSSEGHGSDKGKGGH